MPGILCEHCTGYCCRYIALPIDTPETREDFDSVRWYLIHDGIGAFVEDGAWYLTIQTNCRHLQPDFRCGIYETRPQICRDYSTDNCDYHSGDYGWSHHFSAPEHLDDYLRQNPDAIRAPRKKRRGGNGRGRVGARLGRAARKKQPLDYAALTVDLRGVPLPVLRTR